MQLQSITVELQVVTKLKLGRGLTSAKPASFGNGDDV